MRDDLLGDVGQPLRASQHPLHRDVPGELPFGDLVLAATAFGERVRLEVRADPLVELVEAERVPVAAGYVVVRRLAGRRRGRGDRQDRVHHVVHGDQVHDPLGDPRELRDLAQPVGADDRLGQRTSGGVRQRGPE